MSRRRTNSNSVSLFPFLAVLLCAMGALLFLLIVATRMIRDEAVQKSATAPVVEPIRRPNVASDIDSPVLLEDEITLGIAKYFPGPSPPEAPPLVAPQPVYIVHEPDPLPDVSGKIAKLRIELKALEESRQKLDRANETQKTLQTKRVAAEADIKSREQILKRADAAMLSMKTTLDENTRQLAALNARRDELEQSLKTLTAQVQAGKSQPRTSSNPLKIVPYEGQGGTTRRPLMIECRENAIVFQPEGVKLTERDLKGFTTTVNPVLSGVKALDRFWTVYDGERGVARRPYILIVVRPDGIAAYYALRQLLSEYDQPFGYELLGANQELALEPPDPKASQVLHASVEQVLARREQFASSGTSLFSLEKEQGSSTSSSDSPGKIGRETLVDSRPSANSGHRQFRITPHGLEIIPPGETSESPRSPSPPRAETKPSQSPSDDQPSRPSLLDPAAIAKSRELGTANKSSAKSATETSHDDSWHHLTSEPRQGVAANRDQKQSSALEFPEILEIEPDSDQSNASSSPAPLLPANPLLPGSKAAGSSSSTRKGQGPQQPVISDGKIQFQRELTVTLGANELRVGYGEPISVEPGISTRELLTLTVNELRNETSLWGSPPEHLTWKPVVRFVIQPGGFQHYERMRPYFERHNLVSGVGFQFAESSKEENLK